MNDTFEPSGHFRTKAEYFIIILYFVLYLTAALALILKQPFGNPPDEYNRYLIPQYIASHGTLPNGYEESIRIGGYGFSYAFQPILPYMIQGFCMRLAARFPVSEHGLLLTARCVNLVFGLLMALFVLLLSAEWFRDKWAQYLFCFLVTFLPQSLFIHTYVNTDSCCMLSIAMILYGLTLGIKHHFNYKSCTILSVGIILCALSYYNAYGFILSSMLLFPAYFVNVKTDKNSPAAQKISLVTDWTSLLKKGAFICVFVLLGISWWFIRSGILYEGDILGLSTRNHCASLYALPQFHPDTRITWQSRGFSIRDMLLQSDFINLSVLSFIGVYGPMTIVTSIWIYRFYKLLFFGGLFCCLFLPLPSQSETGWLTGKRPLYRIFFHCNMVFCIIMPVFLSIYYSYSTDYQPQGRYILPMLIPLCYYCIRGIEKTAAWLTSENTAPRRLLSHFLKKPMKTGTICRIFTGLSVLLIFLMVLSLFVTIFCYAYPYYIANPIAP